MQHCNKPILPTFLCIHAYIFLFDCLKTREWYKQRSVEAPGEKELADLLEVRFVHGCYASLAEAVYLPLLLLNMRKNSVSLRRLDPFETKSLDLRNIFCRCYLVNTR